MSQHAFLRSKAVDWFPLLPRPRPPARALHLRVQEIRGLVCSASHGPDVIRLSSAAEALNKAALIASDCGLVDLARQLCWRQFDIFHAAAPLTATTAKLALQPIANLGRLATRSGNGTRAYRIFANAYHAVQTQTATQIDGRDIDFRQLVNRTEARQEIRRFLWTILLADGTRALTKAGRWADALSHLKQHQGIGKRMLDGRQVAILARCTTGHYDEAINLLDDSWAPDPWEHAIATCLRTLCLRLANQPASTSTAAMVSAYLRLEPSPEHLHFRTRLGLCVIGLTVEAHPAGTPQTIDRVIRETVAGTDAYSALDVLAHERCRSSLAEADEITLTDLVALSGLQRGMMPPDLLDDLLTAAKLSEAQLTQVLARAPHRPSSSTTSSSEALRLRN